MNQIKTGELIRKFRTEMKLTQKQLAGLINVSDKTVSKWECGNGLPDISLIGRLADVFGTDINILLSGEINENESEKGNMKKIKFYVCKNCGNVITAFSEAAVICCGNRLAPQEPVKADENHTLKIENIDGELFISSEHEMTKEHYISFAAYQNDRSLMLFRQYPEWNMQINIPPCRSGRIVWYCIRHGLFYQDIRETKK